MSYSVEKWKRRDNEERGKGDAINRRARRENTPVRDHRARTGQNNIVGLCTATRELRLFNITPRALFSARIFGLAYVPFSLHRAGTLDSGEPLQLSMVYAPAERLATAIAVTVDNFRPCKPHASFTVRRDEN